MPTPADIVGHKVEAQAFAHIKTITENGGSILGETKPWWDWPEEIDQRDDFRTWGFKVISILAEKMKKESSEQAR